MMFASSSPEKLATAYSLTPERLEKEYHKRSVKPERFLDYPCVFFSLSAFVMR
jgi:hypothetical protein